MGWFDVLKAARRVGSRREKNVVEAVPFTAAQLAHEAGFADTARSRATDIAAGWISKLVRWGYAKRSGRLKSDSAASGGRPVAVYELTKWGLMKAAPKKRWTDQYEPRQQAATPTKQERKSGGGRAAANKQR